MFTRTIFYTIFLTVILLVTQPTFANPSATIIVNSSLDGVGTNGACTLREAIINANHDDQSGSIDCAAGAGADTIIFDVSLGSPMISLFNGEYDITDALTINGLGVANLTIDGRNVSRIFHALNSSLTITDMTLEDGYFTVDDTSGRGGCLHAERLVGDTLTLTVTNVNFERCEVGATGGGASGGGIGVTYQDVTLTNVVFNNNLASAVGSGGALGGALFASSTTVVFDDVIATNNRVTGVNGLARGGAFHVGADSWNWAGGNVTGNSAESDQSNAQGGGIYGGVGTSADWQNITFHQNSVTTQSAGGTASGGGGLYLGGNLTADSLTATENSVTYDGVATNSNLDGGGIYLFDGSSTLSNSLIQENSLVDSSNTTGSLQGGGIHANNSSLTLENTHVIANNAMWGGGLYFVVGHCPTGLPVLSGGTFQDNVAAWLGGGVAIHAPSSADCPITFSDATVQNNRADLSGGGVHIHGGNVTSDGITIRSNRTPSGRGGGIGVVGTLATGVIRNTTITDNAALGNGDGGGLSFEGSDMYMIEATTAITGNSAADLGGGIYNDGELTVAATSVSNNSAVDGGGIYNRGQLFLTGTAIRNNSVSGDGGGLVNALDGVATLRHVTIDSNDAKFNGGGIASNASTGTITVTQSTLSHNVAATGGGIYHSTSANAHIANSTLSANEVTGNASGVFVRSGGLTLTNATIVDGVGGNGLVQDVSGTVKLYNSIVADNAGDQCTGTITVTGLPNLATDGTCNATLVVVKAHLDVLQDNGGLTETHALEKESAAIDAGDQSVCDRSPVNNVDQRGLDRPTGATCDLGAYEVGDVVPTAVTVRGISAENAPSPIHIILPALAFTCIIGVLCLQRRLLAEGATK